MKDAQLTVKNQEQMDVLQWTPKQVEIVKSAIIKYKNDPATDEELWLFGYVCRKTGLDPFVRQIYAIKRWSGHAQKEVMTIQASIDGLRLTAQRSKKYAGQIGPFWCGEDGTWKDVWLDEVAPSAAKVGALMKDCPEPVWGVARWRSYAQMYKSHKGAMELMGLWKTMKDSQLAKCAEALALRKAFPQELSGVYAEEEMGQADNDEDASPSFMAPGFVPILRLEKSRWSPEQWGEIGAKVLDPERLGAIKKLGDFTAKEAQLMLDEAERRRTKSGAPITGTRESVDAETGEITGAPLCEKCVKRPADLKYQDEKGNPLCVTCGTKMAEAAGQKTLV